MKKNVLIVEDNQTQLEMLRRLVLEVDPEAKVYTADRLNAAYALLMERNINAFLVDIILDTSKPGDTSGLRLVERIRKIPKYMFTPVLFVTSLEDTTKYAYTELNCLGYVEKPFSPEQVKRLVKKALCFSAGKQEDATYYFRKDGVIYPVKVRDIVFMENSHHMVRVHTAHGEVMTIPYKTCKQLLEEVDAECLIQCSRSTIVNKDYIESIDTVNRYISLTNTAEKPEIGITFRKRILTEFKV